MSQPLPSEAIDYERYVDGLRQQNAKMLTALKDIILWAERHGLTKADLITGGQAECPVITNARAAVAQAERAGLPMPAKTITIHIEGGMVQDASDVPAGYELRVEDHDLHDEGHPQWDAEKECVVTIYEGAAA
jgi:hypothetical protein